MTTPVILITRLRTNGHCPPSLLATDDSDLNDVFLQKISSLVYDGIKLREDIAVGEFQDTMKLASANALFSDETKKDRTLIQRRAISLAIIGSTSPNSGVLKNILNSGLLLTIKSWLDDILNSNLGGVDLLLHLLGCIAMLPVSKEMVTSSKLGKQLTVVEKHKICAGSMNEVAIKERIAKVKEEWSASVKRLKKVNSSKRSLDVTPGMKSVHILKKFKPNEQSKKASLSSYLTKVSGMSTLTEESPREQTTKPVEERPLDFKDNLTNQVNSISNYEREPLRLNQENVKDQAQETSRKIVKWADMEGGPLYVSHQVDGSGSTRSSDDPRTDHSKRDRVREKELLQMARKSKLVDSNDSLDTMVMMHSANWQIPSDLPPDMENAPIQVNSKELNDQLRRMLSTLPVSFLSEEDVPANPMPLNENEQAIGMASQVSTVTQKIPFFVPEPIAVPTLPTTAAIPPLPINFAPVLSAPVPHSVASFEDVRSMGLPAFLVGQNSNALQTIAASPGLLNAFVDMNGNFDQGRIMNLVQTLTTNNAGSSSPASLPPPPPPQQYLNIPPTTSASQHYTPNAYEDKIGGSQAQLFQAPPPPRPPVLSTPGSFQNGANSTEGNLHLSGFGPMTTPEAIIQLFTPYVKVDEVVPKNGFMFLNTSDPQGARNAKEALTGVMIGGGPLRINPAVRRNKNQYGGSDTSSAQLGHQSSSVMRDALGQIDYNSVLDDRGNAATRNLFVAGYGPGTNDQQLRQTFSQYCQVTGIVMKGTFSFINTSDKKAAIDAREALIGVNVNGGTLRINFAKESGRLGTSFDGSIANSQQRSYQPPQQNNYYGRSY